MGMDRLEGISGSGSAGSSDDSVLGELIRVGDIVVKQCDETHISKQYELSELVYVEVKKQLDNVEFDEDDLRLWIQMNCDLDVHYNIVSALGLYSGALLQLLTERNREKDNETIFFS